MQSPPLSYSQELIENEEFLSLGSSSSLYIQESSVIQITHEQQSSESQQEEQIIIQDMSFQSQRTQDGVTTTEEQGWQSTYYNYVKYSFLRIILKL